MAGSMGITTGVVLAKSGVTFMARILGQGGAPITIASIASIAYAVRDLTLATTATPGTLTPANVLFDTLQQNDARWDKDSALHPGKDGKWGYNFLAVLPAGLFDAVDIDSVTNEATAHKYQVSFQLTPVSGQPMALVFRFTPIPVWMS